MTQLPLDLSEQPKAPREGALESFHVQSHMTVPEALAGERRAAKQEAAILNYFHVCTQYDRGFRATPSEVHADFGKWPLTSIRRAMTNLATTGRDGKVPPLIHHATDRRPGPMGAKESTWSLAG